MKLWFLSIQRFSMKKVADQAVVELCAAQIATCSRLDYDDNHHYRHFLALKQSHRRSSTFIVKAALNSNCKATWWKRASFCILNLTSQKRIGLHKIEIKASNIFMLYACLKCFCLHCFLLCCCCFLWRRLYVTLVFLSLCIPISTWR